ncbi:hypothetical protein CHELA1G11_20633 [Hyphomicrobiales bacterium]|nr:hypothetical protein CHELA1G11_20633 [Hyphomicrobiales bacterium]CAH1691158.1 hypothetical protein CHELA1G2_20947 [Hyphomicrobiales bacterium]
MGAPRNCEALTEQRRNRLAANKDRWIRTVWREAAPPRGSGHRRRNLARRNICGQAPMPRHRTN